MLWLLVDRHFTKEANEVRINLWTEIIVDSLSN